VNPTTRPPRVLRVIGAVIPVGIEAILWLLPAAMFVTGVVMWRDWHALAREGVDHEARVERCRWESLFAQKRLSSSRGSGYYSCDYLYRVGEGGPTYSGHFQGSRQWKSGEAIAIRYRRDRPWTSAALADLAHPAVVPGSLMALPLLYIGWRGRAAYRARRRIRPTTAT
jgi:hypothetical protein